MRVFGLVFSCCLLLSPAYSVGAASCNAIEVTYWATQDTPRHRIAQYARAHPAQKYMLKVIYKPGTEGPVAATFKRQQLGKRPIVVKLDYPNGSAPMLRGADQVRVRCLEPYWR